MYSLVGALKRIRYPGKEAQRIPEEKRRRRVLETTQEFGSGNLARTGAEAPTHVSLKVQILWSALPERAHALGGCRERSVISKERCRSNAATTHVLDSCSALGSVFGSTPLWHFSHSSVFHCFRSFQVTIPADPILNAVALKLSEGKAPRVADRLSQKIKSGSCGAPLIVSLCWWGVPRDRRLRAFRSRTRQESTSRSRTSSKQTSLLRLAIQSQAGSRRLDPRSLSEMIIRQARSRLQKVVTLWSAFR